jgi:hypothetical protein
MHQNVIAFHAANGMLNKDTDLTQGFIGSLLLIAQWRAGVLFALARLLGRDVNPITPVVRLNAKIASIDSDIDIYKPVQLRRTLLLQHEVIVIVTAKRPPQKDDPLVRERHDRILQRMLFFFPL